MKTLSSPSGWGSPGCSSGCSGGRAAAGTRGGLLPPVAALLLLLSAVTVVSDLRRPEAGEQGWEQRRAVLSLSFLVYGLQRDRSFFAAACELFPGEGNGNPLQPGESHGQRSPAGYSSWGHKESDTMEVT